MKTLRQRYPFSAIVGQEELKQALCEQSRKLRISVTKIENGPDRFF